MKEGAHLFVSGRVQGVFFRKYAVLKAKELSLAGWVHNCVDGRVEILVEGESKDISRFILWAQKGSGFAKVQDVQIDRQPYTGRMKGFEVREFGF